jgi:hypothetical protein
MERVAASVVSRHRSCEDGAATSPEGQMLRTIESGTCMSVQGLVVRQMDDGRVVVRVGDRQYTGHPVNRPLPKAA